MKEPFKKDREDLSGVSDAMRGNVPTPEKSVEEIVEEKTALIDEIGLRDYDLDEADIQALTGDIHFVIEDTLQEALQTERHKREEAVEAERERIMHNLTIALAEFGMAATVENDELFVTKL